MADNDVAFAGAGAAGRAGSRRRGLASRARRACTWNGSSELDPKLNAFRVVLAEQALAEADEAERRRGSADDAPLLGVPIAVKDTRTSPAS